MNSSPDLFTLMLFQEKKKHHKSILSNFYALYTKSYEAIWYF